MNAHVLRPNPMNQGPVLSTMSNQAFMQNPPQMNQQSMVMPPSMNPNPGMNMLGPGNGGAPLPNTQQSQAQHQRIMMQQQAHAQAAGGGPGHQLLPGGAPQQQQHRIMRPGGVPQGMMPPGGPGQLGVGPPPHMSGGTGLNMGSAFPQGMPQGQMQNPPLRRVPSQSQMGMNPGAATGGMSILNPQQLAMHQQQQQQQLRQMHQMQAQNHQNLRPQPHQQPQMGPRQGLNPMMQPSMTGIGPSPGNPVMNSLSQPPSMGQPLPMGMSQGPMQQPFPNGVGMSGPQQPHGMAASSPRPNGMVMGPGPSQPPGNRASITPDNAMGFINYPGNQYSPGGQRMPNGPFQFGPTQTPPSSDMSEHSRGPFPTPAQQLQMSSNAGAMSNQSDPFVSGPSFTTSIQPPRPASQNPMTPHPMHTPQLSQRRTPQPSSQQHRGTPQPASHHPSPMQTAPSNEHVPMRPQSRPQSQPQIPPPHMRASTPRGQTPRSGQVPLPPGATMAPPSGHGGRPGHQPQHPNGPPAIIPPPPPPTQGPQRQGSILQPQHTGGGQPPTPGGGPSEPFGMNPPPPNTVRAPPPPQMNAGPPNMNAHPPRPPISPADSIPPGAALTRFLQLSAVLAIEDKNKLQQQYWTDLVKEYFAPNASFRFQLWKTEDRKEAKYFDIGALILPRFFLATTQAGVTSMSWVVDGARERKLAPGAYQIETAHAEWIYRFSNGYRVALKGMLSVTYEASIIRRASDVGPGPTLATVNPDDVKLLITAFDMNVNEYEKYIKLDSISGERIREDHNTFPVRFPGAPEPPVNSTQGMAEDAERRRRSGEEPRIHIARASMPGEPVNAFGIPQATMRCLELAESVGAMSDLMEYAAVNKLGPLDPAFPPPSQWNTTGPVVALEKFADDLRRHGFKELPDWVKAPFNFPRYETYVQDDPNDPSKRYGQDMNPPHHGYQGGPPRDPGNASGSGMSGQGQQPQQRQNPPGPPPPNMPPGQQPGRQQQPFPSQNGVIPPPPQQQHHTPLMYQPAPPSVMNPPGSNNNGGVHTNGTTPAVIPPPQNATIASPGTQSSSSANSPQKQHRSIPQNSNANASGSGAGGAGQNNNSAAANAAASPSGSTTAGTPLVANASLKRKQAGSDLGATASPTIATAEGGATTTKRNTRKRGRTNTAG